MTVLHYEALNGHFNNVKALLAKGAEIDAEARYNFHGKYTPMIFAAKEGRTRIVDSLIKNDANVEQKTEDGYNAILWAAHEGHKNATLRLIRYYQPKKYAMQPTLL